MDIIIKNGDNSFHSRVRGILEQEGKFLIMRVNEANYFHFPGGHIEIGESSEQATVREIKEEIGVDVIVEKLVCVSEQFFGKVDKRIHETVFYFNVKPKENFKMENTVRFEKGTGIHSGKTNRNELLWVTVEEMQILDVKPEVIKKLIVDNKLDSFCHIISTKQ